MFEQVENRDDEATEPENYGSLSVEDDPDGTEDPAPVGYQPSTGEPGEH